MCVFGDGVRMVNPVNSFGHKDSLLLEGHGLTVFTHYIVKSGKHAETLCNFGMHGTIDVIQKIQGFTDQFVTILEIYIKKPLRFYETKIIKNACMGFQPRPFQKRLKL